MKEKLDARHTRNKPATEEEHRQLTGTVVMCPPCPTPCLKHISISTVSQVCSLGYHGDIKEVKQDLNQMSLDS